MRRQSSFNGLASLEGLESRFCLASIAMFYNANYVDLAANNGTPAAAVSLKAELEGLGHRVATFTGTDMASFTAALAGADLLLVPDMAYDRPILNNTTQELIRGFVSGGGGYLGIGNKNGRTTMQISTVFQFPTLKSFGQYFTSSVTVDTPLDANYAAGTAFANGPTPIRDSGGVYVVADLTQTVSNARPLYSTTDHEGHSNGSNITVAALFPYAGRFPIAFLGRDWERGGPDGTEDNGWKSVLNRAVQQVAKSPASTAPAAPASLSANAAGTGQINLVWQDKSSNEGGFQIERSATANGTYALIATAPINATSYSNSDLRSGTKYYYRIRAINTAGSSGYSNTANATTAVVLPTVPTAPAALAASAVSETSIKLTWQDKSNNESGFQLERASSAAGPFTLIATASAQATSHTVSGLAANTAYHFRIRATNAGGNSAYTGVASATTLAPAGSVLTASLSSKGTLYVNGTDGAEIIRLYRSGSKLRVGTTGSNTPFTASKVKRINLAAKGGNDIVLIARGVRGSNVDGGEGNDQLFGGDSNDTLLGGNGNDTIIGGNGLDSIDGGSGDDLIYANDAAGDIIAGGAGTDILVGDEEDTATLIEELL